MASRQIRSRPHLCEDPLDSCCGCTVALYLRCHLFLLGIRKTKLYITGLLNLNCERGMESGLRSQTFDVIVE
jgi:hypothetical protein